MTRKLLIISIYCIYIAFLFIVAINYKVTQENVTGFAAGLGTGLTLTFKYLAISLLSSSAFLIIVSKIHKKLTFFLILFAPFLNIVACFIVAIVVAVLLWISQLQETVNIFEKIFLIATISTTATSLWLLSDMFKGKKKHKNIAKESLENSQLKSREKLFNCQ